MEFRPITPSSDKEYRELLALRNDVLRAPLGLSLYDEDLSDDKQDIIIGLYDDAEVMIGCVMLHPLEGKSIKLRQMAVQPAQQGKGYGAALVSRAEVMAKEEGYNTITMHARITAVPFYEKLGYTGYGDEFMEVTIPHIAMQKQLL